MTAELIIVGGGPVGLSFAIAASQLPNLTVTVIERDAAAAVQLPEPFDHRVYALSPGSLDFLRDIGAELPVSRLAPIRAMQVWGDDLKSELDFAAGQPLATIAEHAAVMQALQHRLAADGRVRFMHGVSPTAMRQIDGNRRSLILPDGGVVESDLLIASDGARSQLREWAGIASLRKNYESDGVVANFHCQQPHGDIARQWFRHDSVLAFLPLPGNHVSIVWSVATAFSRNLPTGDASAFATLVGDAGQHVLGAMTLISPVARFPLTRVVAADWVQPGLALMGDAAHAVHPLAGQGVNLGFADARKMVELLAGRSRYAAIGDPALLRQYERARREAAWAVGEVTDRLRGLYLSEIAAAKWIRNQGLRLTNRLPAVKSMLVDYAAD